MSHPLPAVERRLRLYTLLVALLASILGACVYANALWNPFQLDDLHSIRDNPYVRSLAHVPHYFTDARTFTRFLPNADYRPVLQTSYALNYAIAGYAPWIWHLTNLALHVWVALCVYLLGRRLIGERRLLDAPLTRAQGELSSVLAALLFTVHPLASGCVNYVSTRSSMLVAAWVLPATLCYLRSMAPEARGTRGGRWSYVGALVLFVLALFTKAEGISFLAVAALAECVLRPRGSELALPWRMRAARVAPLAALALLYLGLRRLVVPPEFAVFAGSELSPVQYLMTQTHAWWYYVGRLLAPVGLIADYMSYPVSQRLDARVALALVGWAVVALLVWRGRRRAPQAAFLVGAFLLHLAPTSSVMPLTDMVNEHRPYLPSAGLVLLFTGALVCIVRGHRAWILSVALPLLAVLGWLTYSRNPVFATAESFWADVVAKDPAGVRGLVNYGVELLQRREFARAEQLFRAALEREPNYVFARINLGVVLAAQERPEQAREQYDAAVRTAPALADPYYWRGRFHAQRGEWNAALADLQAAELRAGVPTRELLDLVEVYLRLGRRDEALEAARRGAKLDPQTFARYLERR